MAASRFYVTTPIYYVNDKPHLGHAYTTLICDMLRRYHQLLGEETFFLTGTDEHGEKIFREAKKKGVELRRMIDENSQSFRDLWPRLGVENDDFIRTTDERHVRVVREVLQHTYDQGDIYLGQHEGDYCVQCERFYTEKDTETPGRCPIHETDLEHMSEENYYFRLGKYQDWLREKIESDPDFLQPQQYRKEVLALLREPLDDLCISRPKERMHWGIPLPFDENFVTYVWYDALLNYISALGYPDGERFEKFWPVSMHLIAKDILRQHAVYWPCMLQAAGIPSYRALRVHGYWTVEGRKMSKTLGNFLDPMVEVDKWGLDVFRYFLAREMVFGTDGSYSAAGLVGRNNAELANDLGNLLSRLTSMIAKYCGGFMPEALETSAEDEALTGELQELVEALPGHLEQTSLHQFLEKVMALVNETNRYITEQAPWALAKKGEIARVQTILAVASRTLVGAGQLLYPVMPGKMTELLACYGMQPPTRGLELAPPCAGAEIRPAQPLFSQLELPEPPAEPEPEPDTPQAAPIKPEIAFEDFAKIDLRTARVLAAEPVPKTDKLLKLELDTGADRRQIVAGVAEHYKPEQLVGRTIVIVANLAPRKLRGEVSQGMLLAARGAEGLFLLGPDAGRVEPGAEVS